MKGLDALKELKETCETHMGRMVYILQENKFETIEKELKALEIIKKHFFIKDFQDFVTLDGRVYKFKKEECDLLKEVML